MVAIKPFRGYHYDFTSIDAPAERLVAPPYDVISDEMKRALCSEPLNICNVMLGNKDDSYSAAARLFKSWLSSGKIVQDAAECYYAYEQTYKLEGRILSRTGVMALLKLEPLGKNILPHEMTHPKAKADRLELLGAINANIEQLFLIYDDKKDEVGQVLARIKQPANEVLSFTDPDGVRHRIFRIPRESDVALITSVMKDKKALIADGHHRYETALEHSKRVDAKAGEGPHDYVLVTLVNTRDPGLIMLPTHRLLYSIEKTKVERFEQDLRAKFDVDEVGDMPTLLARLEGQEGCSTLGFWLPKKGTGLVASLKTENCSHDPLEKLDVHVLHRFVIEEILGITHEMQERKEHIEFVKGTEQALQEAGKGNYDIVCLLNPASIPDVFDAAETGKKMPHKSTYFFPKLWSGLVIYVF